MRLWSLNPDYLDSKGLTALWRESLLARKVLQEKTRGYKNHSQLIRFKETPDPLAHINYYLKHVFISAKNRGFCFDVNKLDSCPGKLTMHVNKGQLMYELNHLREKLQIRDFKKLMELECIDDINISAHPMFIIINGDIESWERIG